MLGFTAPSLTGAGKGTYCLSRRMAQCSRTRRQRVERSMVDGGDGGNIGGGGYSGGDGGGGEEGGNEQESPEVLKSILRDAGKKLHTLPPDVVLAIDAGLMTSSQLQNYLKFDAGSFGWLLRSMKSFRDRFLCDEQFVFKLLAQELIGNGTSLAGEFIERREHIIDELEYVFSDLMIGTVVEAAFVWLLTPRVPFPALQTTSVSALRSLINALPASVFEANTATRSYSLMQRIASLLFVSSQYMAIGFGCGIIGTILVYGMIKGRQMIQPDYVPKRSMPEVVPNSLGWGLFLATSSNFRFQVVEGMEIALARLLKQREMALKSLIVILRFANNLYGGVQFVQFFRLLGLQDTE